MEEEEEVFEVVVLRWNHWVRKDERYSRPSLQRWMVKWMMMMIMMIMMVMMLVVMIMCMIRIMVVVSKWMT